MIIITTSQYELKSDWHNPHSSSIPSIVRNAENCAKEKVSFVSVLKISPVGVSGVTGNKLIFLPLVLILKKVEGTTDLYLPKSEEYPGIIQWKILWSYRKTTNITVRVRPTITGKNPFSCLLFLPLHHKG